MSEEEHGNDNRDLLRIVWEGIPAAPRPAADRWSRPLNKSILVPDFPLRYSWISEGEPAEW